METKSIISANICSSLVRQLKNKTKGTRSRTIERALRAYLKGESDYSIADISTKRLTVVLLNRMLAKNNYQQTPLTLLLEQYMMEEAE